MGLSPSPGKLLLERRGREDELDAWAEAVLARARMTGALEGSSVFAHEDRRFVLLRFRSEDALHAWRTAQTEILVDSHPYAVRTGLETWFTLPGHPVARMPPPRWKMALLTWLALMPTVFTMGKIVPRVAPSGLVLPVSTGIAVATLTWVLMPNLTRLVQRWLYPRA